MEQISVFSKGWYYKFNEKINKKNKQWPTPNPEKMSLTKITKFTEEKVMNFNFTFE